MIGRIEKIWEKTAKNGNRYWLLSIDGKLFAAWKEELVNGLKEGEIVDITWKDFGRFRNLESVGKVWHQWGGMDGIDKRSMHIIKMSCLRSAVNLLSGLRKKRLNPSRVLALANMFESYVSGNGPTERGVRESTKALD